MDKLITISMTLLVLILLGSTVNALAIDTQSNIQHILEGK